MKPHRDQAYTILSGRGLEIGAFHEPAKLGAQCSVKYFDAIDEREAAALFPEVDPSLFVHVDYKGNLDSEGLAVLPSEAFDFVIINHVLEHVTNPFFAIKEVFRVLKTNGFAVISIPDKRFTFDSKRELTPWEHLWGDYLEHTTVNSDEHYIDFLKSAAPHVFDEPPANLPVHIERVRSRREHAHVWTSESFKAHLSKLLPLLDISAELVKESTAETNHFEYFCIWRKV
jgi:SAM-dependent methyltransferase